MAELMGTGESLPTPGNRGIHGDDGSIAGAENPRLASLADLPKVLDVARRPNAVIKISGACTLSREPYPSADIWDPLARVFDAWGSSAAGGVPTGLAPSRSSTYEQAVEAFRQADRLSDSERTMLMGGACAKAHRWSPRKG